MFRAIKRFFQTQSDAVSICIPAYNAASFIRETLESILRQSHQNLRILVSIDLSIDGTIQQVRSLAVDHRIQLFIQKERLGWIKNTNFLLDKVDTPYFCIIPHDDLVSPLYITRLLENLKNHPRAIAAYADINCFGSHSGVISQESVTGNLIDRVTQYLNTHYNAVVMRALINRKNMTESIFFNSNPYLDFAEDTLFGLQLAMQGDFVRLPKTLYSKRYHPNSYHRQWQTWSEEQMLSAWKMHNLQCAKIVSAHHLLQDHYETLFNCHLNRFTQRKANLWHRDKLKVNLSNQIIIEDFIMEIQSIYGR